jgi:secreted Zn-dependent insulinase-like peptidase
VLEEPLYDTLRTKWQLGYSVSVGLRITNGVLGLCVRVQSERFPPQVLHARIDEFLLKFRERLANMDERHFTKQLLALVQLKLQRDASYHDEADR